MSKLKIKPAKKGLIVRDPNDGKPLKETGEEKPRNIYWLRRIKDKSVVDMNAKKTTAQTKETES